MNRIERISALLLAIVLILGVALQPGIGEVFAENVEQVGEYITSLFAAEGAAENAYIYFDLAAGNITIGKNSYSGYVFVEGDLTPKAISSLTRTGNEKFYIYQSNMTDTSSVGYYTNTGYKTETDYENKANCRVPNYSRVSCGTQSWTDYIENNIEVKDVSINWDDAAGNSGREKTENYITFASESDYTADVTIDNIWSTYYDPNTTWRKTGGIGVHLQGKQGEDQKGDVFSHSDTHISLRLKGDNRVGCVHYSAGRGKGNTITFYDGEDGMSGSITVADFNDKWDANHWNSAIGGADNPAGKADQSDGIIIESGVIYAGTTWEDNCTAIGGGGNDYGGVKINGGTITAVTAGTGTAIGGGIGYGDPGGDTDVTIEGGTIYAYNLGIDKQKTGGFANFVPAAAIGGGGSNRAAGALKANITITGGTIYAQSMGGPGIGGGGSALDAGGSANMTITGGTIIAKSIGGMYDTQIIDPGVSIGGGTGFTAGGSVTLNIGEDKENGKKTIIRAGSIGGGSATGKDADGKPNKVGSANVRVDGGDIIGQVIMAGGAANPCSFTMTGGVIHSTNVIDGVTIGDENITGVTVTDPRDDVPLLFKREDGGAVFMNDPNGVATITGGLISNCTAKNGGAVYMAGGAFTLSGTGQLGTNRANENGGSVYVGGGTVQIGGGVTLKDGTVLVDKESEDASKCAIRNSTALKNGGGVYVVGKANQEGATVTMEGGEIHSNTAGTDGGGMYIDQGKVDLFGGSIHGNKATQDGGGIYVAGDVHMLGGSVTENSAINGGGFCVEDGTVLMYGGSIDNNSATENGGAMHVSATNKASAANKEPIVDIFSGSISNNSANKGGGVSVISEDGLKPIHVTVGVNCEHTGLDPESREFAEFEYTEECGDAHISHEHFHLGAEAKKHSSCPQIINNAAKATGGGFFLKSSQSSLVFYCVTETGNQAQGNSRCDNMDVEGGQVIIGDNKYDYTKSDPVKGNIIMQSSILVNGGTVDIYGTMQNPDFTDDVTVDIKNYDTDHYIDHRFTQHDASHPLEFYKVHYYENFKGDGDKPTGLYIARQYPDLGHDHVEGNGRYDFTIMSSIFSHPGYKIVGWNSKPDDKGKKYEVNKTYNFKDLESVDPPQLGAEIPHNGSTIKDDSLLVIYAIWERCGYVLKFDPNVGEGETYTGTMENQRVTMGDGTQKISKNQFKRPGYSFVGWTLNPIPADTDTVYNDGQEIGEDFTQEDGATVTLYAQWESCNHEAYLTYTAEENVLTQSCLNCGGHTATATVSAVNAVYDGNTHLATASFSSNWIGTKPEISYEMAADVVWDKEDTVDDEWKNETNHQPLHAGNYTAKLAAGVVTAQAEYVISPVKWETPDVPQISFAVEKVVDTATYNSIITINSPTGGNVMYLIKQLSNSGEETGVEGYLDWNASNQFANIPLGNYYYFYAKMCADRDHIESDSSKSEAYLTTGGNIVYIESGVGIKVVPHYGDSNFKYTVSADDGYHLREYHDNLTNDSMSIGSAIAGFVEPIPGAESNDAYINADSIKISRSSPENWTYEYIIELKDVAYHQITLKFSGAAQNASVTSKVTDGEVFGDFNGKEDTIISRDSAFTAQFAVSDYIPDEYTGQKLSFSQPLPVGTTVIMKGDDGYWYYNLDTTSEPAIDLTKFTEMGGEGKFSFNKTDTSAKKFTYQFIVDFSKTAVGSRISEQSLGVSLVLTAVESKNAPNIPAQGSPHISVDIREEAKFTLTAAAPNGKTATLTGNYTPSQGAASIWNGRETSLVLTAPATAPADLTLTAVVDGSTTLYKMNTKTNADVYLIRQFIIPLGDVGGKEVKITLNSYMFSSSESSLDFKAEWYVAQSSADKSPLNGYPAASCNVTFSGKKDSVPSVRIDGTKRLLHANEVLEVTVNYLGIPNDGSVIAYLQRKKGEQYVDTGAKDEVNAKEEGNSKKVTFNMGQMDKGSYRVLVIVQDSGANILQVPYYFVIE